MTIYDYRRVLRERWLILLVVVLLALAGSAAAFALRPPVFTAELQMYVTARTMGASQTPLQGAQLAQNKVKSFVELASSNRVATSVVRLRDLRTTPDELSSRITASSGVDSLVISVFVTDSSAEEAAATVNAVGDVLSKLVDELERAGSAPDVAPVSVQTVQQATAPTKPSSMSLPKMLVLGLLLGIVAGIITALTRNATDNSIKSTTQLNEASGAPNLGTIAHHSKMSKRPLIVHDDPQSATAEAFRRLRTNVQFVAFDNPHKALLVTSPLPGEGRTITLVNLAIALASAGRSVLIIEADLRNPRAAEILGVDGSIGLTSVLAGRLPVQQALKRWTGGAIDILPSGPLPPNPSELLASPQMRSLLEEVRRHYSVVLIDTPALLPTTDAAAIAPATDGAILLCRFQKTTRPQIETAAEALRAVGAPILGTVLNMANASDSGSALPRKRAVGPADAPVSTSGSVLGRPVASHTREIPDDAAQSAPRHTTTRTRHLEPDARRSSRRPAARREIVR